MIWAALIDILLVGAVIVFSAVFPSLFPGLTENIIILTLLSAFLVHFLIGAINHIRRI